MSEKRFYEVIKSLWKKSSIMENDDLYDRFIKLIQKVADLTWKEFKNDTFISFSAFTRIDASHNIDNELNISTISQLIYELSVAYFCMKKQHIKEGKIEGDKLLNKSYIENCLTLTTPSKNTITVDSIKEVMKKAKNMFIRLLGEGQFSLVFQELEGAFELCQNIKDVYLITWRDDEWIKNAQFEVLRKPYKGFYNRSITDYYYERIRKHEVLNEAKEEIEPKQKVETKPSDEAETKEENEILKSHKMTTKRNSKKNMTSKQKIESLTKEFMSGLTDNLSNFKISIRRLISNLKDDPNIDMSRKSPTYKQFKEIIKELLTASKEQGKISEATYKNYYEDFKHFLRKQRMAEMTLEERKAYRQKQDEERKKRMEEREREKNKDWTQDEDFLAHFKNFLTSHSIHDYIANHPVFGMFLGPMSRDVRNDQQKLTKDIAEQVFAEQYGYNFLNKNQKKAFYALLEEYPNNLFDTEEEFQDYVKSWGEEMMSRERKKEFKILYGLFKRDLLKSVNRGLAYEPIDENEESVKTYDVEDVMIENPPIKEIVKEAVKEAIKKTKTEGLSKAKPKLSNLKRINEKKSINTMNEVDKAKTEESVKDVNDEKPEKKNEVLSKAKPYVRATRPQYSKEKETVIKVARTPKAKISFDEALKKQLKNPIKEHPFNFEVYQNPTKSTITFNKKGDTATIRPTFKAKITFT